MTRFVGSESRVKVSPLIVSSFVGIIFFAGLSDAMGQQQQEVSVNHGAFEMRVERGISADIGTAAPALQSSTLTCTTTKAWDFTLLRANENIFGPTMRLLGAHSGQAYHSIVDSATAEVDMWSREGWYKCNARWDAYTPDGFWLDGEQSETMILYYQNPTCSCVADTQNRAITRRNSIGIVAIDINLPGFAWESLDIGRAYWNGLLQDSGSPVRIDAGYGIPVYVGHLANPDAAAEYIHTGSSEAIVFDPDFFNLGWDPLVWDHVATHELGHALGFKHGYCGQDTTVMFTTVTPDPNTVIGRNSVRTPTDTCYVFSEYKPVPGQ